MPIDYIHVISQLFDNLFIGFSLFVILISLFKIVTSVELKQRLFSAQQHAYELIKYLVETLNFLLL